MILNTVSVICAQTILKSKYNKRDLYLTERKLYEKGLFFLCLLCDILYTEPE